jgi:hypothetical protein
MKRHSFRAATVGLGLTLMLFTLVAWGQGGRPDNKKEEVPTGPMDPKLIAIQKDFVLKAEKLAKEYETNKQSDKARAVCEEILKIAPRYPPALELLKSIQVKEATAEKANFDIHADQGWQDTGINLIDGKPVTIVAQGTWTFKLEFDTGPEGKEIPKEIRDFKLGSLIGYVDTGSGDLKEASRRVFHIGNGAQFMARDTGRLYMKMHSGDPRDNKGKVAVEIRGTFEKGKSK